MKIREKKKEKAKKKIYSSAMRLFAEKGFDNTTISEIANLAGVSRGSFFNYFRHKEAVLIFHVSQYFNSLEADILGNNKNKSPFEIIYCLTDRFAIYAAENKHLVVPLCFELLNTNPERSKHAFLSLGIVPLIRQNLELARAQGQIRQDYSIERLTRTLANSIFLSTLYWANYRSDGCIRKELKIALDLCLNGLVAGQ
ncbi:MAG TPA: TetR/AcrR family transcriptional regulator [Trueperaceae bacterium]|nr:TetR/AcrR family transcriptional regulator [Trueperaceae bacterium]